VDVVVVDGDEALHEAVRQRRLGHRAAVELQHLAQWATKQCTPERVCHTMG
jgi:hypothetical protein